MKNFGQKAWMLPQPVLIIGTYNSDGTPNAMNAAWGGQWDAKDSSVNWCACHHRKFEPLRRFHSGICKQKHHGGCRFCGYSKRQEPSS